MVAGLLGIIAEDPEINRSLIAGRSPDPANAIILASFRSIEDKISDIITLNEIVEDLRVENEFRLPEVNDWQNRGIVAFTVLTIIFLPLSFVSGVFGMNTSDVRNMQMTQWAYWASAVPLTVLILCLTLWLMIKLRGPPPAEKKEDDDDEKRSPARHEDIERGLSGWEKGREA